MKFTLSWLKSHLETTATLSDILDAMTMVGLEVEHVEDPSQKLESFSVAKIVATAQHPNADRLQVCQVDTFEGRKEIVCGAPNARPGLTTIYAPLGTFIPGSGITLEPRAVRGVVSNGMLCSAAELELSDESDGILELDDALAVGVPASDALGLDDAVIDFEVTPNRPDWLGVDGIARELAAAGLGTLKTLQPVPAQANAKSTIQVAIADPDLCPAFAGRLIKGVKNGPSPAWLQARLRAIGLRPINALVDITNLIAYDRARPLHVYDAAKLDGDIQVRRGREGESFVALDGKTYGLTTSMCVIADQSGALGLGGIMGGASTGCDEATIDVFVESALFAPLSIFQTGRATGITSDAKYRFERGVDPAFMMGGLELATEMILELCGGTACEAVLAGQVPTPDTHVDFAFAEVQRLTGLELPSEQILKILTDLGFAASNITANSATLKAPSWRKDVQGPADLVEDVARIAGFDLLPSTRLAALNDRKVPLLSHVQNRVLIARRALASRGWAETVSWSFASLAACELFGASQGGGGLVLANPIAADLDCMRPSALIHLIMAAGRNADRGFGDLALFEAGPIYLSDQPDGQKRVIAGVTMTKVRHWDKANGASADVYGVKADILAMLEAMGIAPGNLQIVQGARAWWHPGRSGSLRLGPKVLVAEFGQIHPSVARELGVSEPLFGFELFVDALPASKAKATKAKPKFSPSSLMPVKRDFAFVVPSDKAAGDLIRAVSNADKALITDVALFDRYAGPGLEANEVSLGLQVTLQPKDQTLTEAELEAVSQRIIVAAAKQGARLR
jgi:phenylalanyl-tRNA synthetase beta chain